MTNRGHIGCTTAPTTITVDAWRVKLVCQAVGETDPVYWDEPAARNAGRLQALQTRFTGVALLGDRLRFEATLLDPTTGHCKLSAHTDGGTPLVSGSARVALS